ncbi:hypothetical protein CAPTEDRAFT_210518 [Capitella teleta]|uniref:Endonuclease/exonuclease/phosphatase domain-containing protein n=1 Tax=Capitella teleta TaxID=283909 RepID=R7VF90_CAPTE|nr:hypothetical protein CAPTEDRAFT_210518 [Capitella teleta]|eukprot:ELU17227.1 hypothetical protein CAPTEDRAFT_210518 [Capitella teleta]
MPEQRRTAQFLVRCPTPVHPDAGLQNMLQQQIAETRMMNANFQRMMVFVNQLQDEMQKIKEDNAQLHQIVTKQQSFLEDIDFQQRGCNLIVTGLNENEPCTINGETVENDEDKINLILHTIEMRDVKPVSITRLGKLVESRARPIKVVLDSRDTRSNILRKTSTLKNTPAFSKVFMKADTHPAYREEWRRLSQIFWTEKNRTENQGHNIVFDKKNRITLRDDPPYFALDDLASLQCRIHCAGKKRLLIGDMNARRGVQVSTLLSSASQEWRYDELPDPVPQPKSHGKIVLEMCKHLNAVIINNLSTGSKFFRGSLTFRERQRWISELDLCIISSELVHLVDNLVIDTSFASLRTMHLFVDN